MSLLETRNKKFNLPFIFIAGVIFIIGLSYFANYLENFDKNALNDLDVVESEIKNTEIKVQLTTTEIAYLDSLPVKSIELKEKIKLQLDGQVNPTILLYADEGVNVNKVVEIMEFASEHTYKVILGVRSK